MTEDEKKIEEVNAAHIAAAEANRNAKYVDLWKLIKDKKRQADTKKHGLKRKTTNGSIS